MRMLVALLLILLSNLIVSVWSKECFIVFGNDGSFYKLDIENKQMQWHNQLPFKLLSLNITSHLTIQNQSNKYLVPTIEGDFLYLQHNILNKYPKQILVFREDVEHLLHMCFDDRPQQKYLVYQQVQYFVLSIDNGQYINLQSFFNEKKVLNRSIHAIIIVSRKLLKQFNLKMQVKWSVISSKIQLKSIDEFATTNKIPQHQQQHKKYIFMRSNSKIISILKQNYSTVFEFQGFSAVLSIFTRDAKTGKFYKIFIKNTYPQMLALSQRQSINNQQSISTSIADNIIYSPQPFNDFPYTSSYTDRQLTLQQDTDEYDKLQMCINTHKILKQSLSINKPRIIGLSSQKFNYNVFHQLGYNHYGHFNSNYVTTLPYSKHHNVNVIVTKQQPFVYIFIIVIIVGGGLLFYRFKFNKFLEQVCQQTTTTNKNLKIISAKLDQYQNVGKEIKKIYDINWNKIIYQNSGYLVFQGKFLNQVAEVFVFQLKDLDVGNIEEQLNLLVNCSHKSIVKIYYFTKNDDSFLVFCQSTNQYRKLSELKPEDKVSAQIFQRLQKCRQTYKNSIKLFLTSIKQLINIKLQIPQLSKESILINNKNDSKISIEIKINIIYNLFFKNNIQIINKYINMGTTKFRFDVVNIIHQLGNFNQQFDLLTFEKFKNNDSWKDQLLKHFYQQILLINTDDSKIQLISDAEKHPFLWDSMQKMLYINSFSNYLETYIDESKISKMQDHCRNYKIIKYPWVNQLHPSLSKQINNYRKYDYTSIRDLIRYIRNKLNHFNQIPKQARNYIGKTPEEFIQYILNQFPKLLSFMFVYQNKKKWKIYSKT